MTKATAEDKFPMVATSETRFWVKDYDAPIVFKRDNSGKVSLFYYRGMTCPKLEDVPEPNLEQLAELKGEYVSEELKATYTIALEEGRLVAMHRRHGTISLTYAHKDDFRGGIWFLNSLEFFRNERGDVVGFNVTQGRSRNQKFIKNSNLGVRK